MKRNSILVVAGLLVVLTLGGVWAYNLVLGETEEASAPISAIPLEAADPTAESGTPTEAPAAPTAEPTTAATADIEPTDEPPTEAPASERVIYTISQESSQASFSLSEELRGQPVTVVGVTNQVAGEVALDLADLSTVEVGILQVNARTLATDENRRNQAIRNFILQTDTYEFITFTPSGAAGLSGAAAVGQNFSFQIPGELTIRDITRPVVFDLTAQVVAEDQIEGSASAVIQRGDFNLTIPNVPFVANVGEEVTIQIDFTLVPREG